MDERSSAEQWRPVVGFGAGYYEVSDLGRVRSLDRTVSNGRSTFRKAGRVLKPGLAGPKGYPFVALSVNGETTQCYVHTLVLEAWVGPRPSPKHEARHHPDLTPTNVALSNLCWGTRTENTYDAIGDGTHYFASRETCPRGHELVEPNLTPNIKADGNRGCYACSLTHAWGHTHSLRVKDQAWIDEANRRHAEILHFGEPIRYSKTGRDVRWTPPA